MLTNPLLIREMHPDDFDQGLALLQSSFHFTAPSEDRALLREFFQREQRFGVFAEQGLQSQLGILPLDYAYNDHAIPAAAISRVSSWPEYRGQGNIRHLITHALQRLSQQNKGLVLLSPFDIGFYRRYGWELISDYHALHFSPRAIPHRQLTTGRMVKGAPEPAIALALFNASAQDFGAAIVRDEAWWRYLVIPRKSGQAAHWVDAQGHVAGYVLYDVQDVTTPSAYQQLRGQRQLVIHELVYQHEQARRQLWAFIAGFASGVDAIHFTTFADDPLYFELSDRLFSATRHPHLMARIVCLETFVAHYPFVVSQQPLRVVLQVTDADVDGNQGLWALDIQSTGARATRISDDADNRHCIALDIASLTTVLLGYQRPTRLAAMGKIAAAEHDIALLESVIPQSRSYYPEFF
ncbi:hypothetical protein CIG19_02220 [Enterobacterales bacterium CwR94]|nr:hypothetical protein CIG19_02220 [Enterobacterales bacterium CwR94]